MRLLELHLKAFGHFTDRRLDLSGGKEGLHLVFGANEAGKSTALRALHALLYGVPERTSDTFAHGTTALRVGGRFSDGDGQEILCYRRKGRKGTLLDERDDPIDEGILGRLLHGVDAHLFQRLFGIDHVSLVAGGQALLAEHGREAEALFGSGLGSTRIHSVLNGLDQEAKALFMPRGSKPLINASLARLGTIQRDLREVSLSARQWDEARKARNRARQALEELDARLAEARRRQRLLDRIRRTLPMLAKRAGLRERLATLGQVPRLPDDFARRRAEADERRRLAREAHLRTEARLADLREKAAMLSVSDELLASAEAIDALREQLGSHRKAAQDRPALDNRATTLRSQVRQRLAVIGSGSELDEVERLRPLLKRRGRVSELGGRREALDAAVRGARTGLAEIDQGLEAKRAELRGLHGGPAPEPLRQTIASARRAGDLDRAIEETAQRLSLHEEACERELGALGLWTQGLDALRRAPLPGAESLRRLAADGQTLDEEERRLRAARAEAEAERQRTGESLLALQLAGAVPSEKELEQARTRRDQGWQLVRRRWQGGAAPAELAAEYDVDRSLPDAYELAVSEADALADRLRRESQWVHEQAAAQARLESQRAALGSLDAALAALAARRTQSDADWHRLWAPCGVEPRPPREMEEWLGRALRLREKADEGDALQQRLAALAAERATQLQALRDALAELSDPDSPALEAGRLAPVLQGAETRLQALERSAERRRALTESIAELEARRARLTRDLAVSESEHEEWRSDWSRLMAELGLPAEASQSQASQELQSIDEMLKLLDESASLLARVAGIDADARAFASRAAELLGRLAPDLLDQTTETAVPSLHRRLVEQRETRSRLDELRGQIERAEHEIAEAETERRAAESVLAELCGLAGCNAPERLAALEAGSAERQRLETELESIERQLIEGGDGLDLAALEAEAGSVSQDALMQELTALDARIDQELQPERETLLERRLEAERAFTAMAGDDRASALAEDAEQVLSGLRALAERYARVKLAARVLRDAIEQFRRHHRDPILALASGYLAKLTCGSLVAVDTGLDDADRPVLVGVRPSGERLGIEAMSTGTRDQLYLALRLATLDHYLDSAEPLPFVVDDILIQFDDERAKATLGVLADFSDRTQVILFTHHARVVEQARSLEGVNGQVLIQALE